MENIENGEKHGFACMEDLLDYLWQITAKGETTEEGRQAEVQG